MKKQILTIAICSFIGGMFGSALISSTQAVAKKQNGEEHFYTTNFYNNDGKRIGVVGSHNSGEGLMFLMNGNNGQTEIQMGAYGASSERGQTLFGMHDRAGHLRLLMRMHGPKDSPTIIMKDNAGQDKIVFGLDGTTQDAYFKYMNTRGEIVNLF